MLDALNVVEVQRGRRAVRTGRHPARDRGGRADRRAPGAERPLHPARVARLRRAARTRRASAWAGTSRSSCVDRAGPPTRGRAARPNGPRSRRGRPLLPRRADRRVARRPSSTAASRSSSSPRAPASCGSRTASRCPCAAATPSSCPGTPAPGGSRAMSSAWRAGRRRPTREARRDRPPAGHRRGHLGVQGGLVDRDGVERAHGQSDTPWRRSPTGAEIECEALFEAAVAAARAALAGAPDGRVRAIGVTSMAEAGALLDGGGLPLAPVIAWHDARGDDEARRLAEDLGAERFVESTGLPATPALLPGQAGLAGRAPPGHARGGALAERGRVGRAATRAARTWPSCRSPREPACSTCPRAPRSPMRSPGPGCPATSCPSW